MSTETVNRQIQTGTWTVDPVHSSISFAITHSGVATYRSGFSSYEATLHGGENAKLEGSVDVASIDVAEDMLKGHLLGPDFFDAEKYPQLKFTSTALDVADDGSVRLSGDLELQGQTRAVQAVGRYGGVRAYLDGGERLGLSLEAAVDRRDFGIDWNADLPSGGQALEYEVAINVELEFVTEAE